MVMGTEGFEKENQGFGNHTCLFSIEICVENNDAKTKDIGKTLYTCVTAFHEICLYSVNPFSTLFSANIQHNCPILFLYMPNLLTSRTSTSFFLPKAKTYLFSGKVTPSAI